ncbi:hypothetical protein B484DRAFT_38313 [Ochromonadaceae sp. CCMP2298]|nr:hypothetical protein B484DRAFT_38313 [Ochromonadaceae sp. CCMP2298]
MKFDIEGIHERGVGRERGLCTRKHVRVHLYPHLYLPPHWHYTCTHTNSPLSSHHSLLPTHYSLPPTSLPTTPYPLLLTPYSLGPPGTGKSTLVYHIDNSFLGKNTISLATCVQNKAVDAIAEKLATGQIGFFVVGNEDRLGLFAKMWTLDAQMYRNRATRDLDVIGAAEAHGEKKRQWEREKERKKTSARKRPYRLRGGGLRPPRRSSS